MSLREVCKLDGMPGMTTVMRWLSQFEEFRSQYARAKEAGAEYWAEEILEIADDGQNDWMERNARDEPGWVFNGEAARRSQIRIDARKWLLSKLMPKKYGDKVAIGGDPDNPLRVDVLGSLKAMRERGSTD